MGFYTLKLLILMVKKSVKIAKWILIVTSLFFGIVKLLISPDNTTAVFGSIGGATAQYFTGVYQIVEAVLMMFPGTAFIGALMVAISMVVAILLHIFVIGFAGPFVVLVVIAFVLILISVKVMKGTWNDLGKRKR